MNPQVSPWMIIADHQRYTDLKRQRQERQLKNNIRANYQKQLMDQMNVQRQMKMLQKQKQKQWEKNMINASIQNQQKIILLEKMKAQASNEKKSRLDYENDYLKAARKQRQYFMQDESKRIQNQMHRQAEQKLKRQMAEAQMKKKMVLQSLKGSMQDKQQRQKMNKLNQQQFQNYKMKQGEMLNQREQNYRQQYLRKLKQRSMTIDYGSHNAFSNNHYKTLVQRKKQEWQSQQQYLNRARQLDTYQNDYKKLKSTVEKDYRTQLQRQMQQKQHKKRLNSRLQLQKDHDNIMRYQQYSKSVDMQKKQSDQKTKKQLLQYLKQQVDYKKSLAKQPYFMRDKQIQLNYELLQKSKGIIPGQTYDLDPARKKQLQTVAKSMAYSPTRVDRNYLAEIGKTVFN